MTIVADPADAPIKIINIGIANALSVNAIKNKPNASGNKKRNKMRRIYQLSSQPQKLPQLHLTQKKGRRMLKE